MSETMRRAIGVFRIVNTSCSSCARTIATRLWSLDGVLKVGINYITEKAYINYNPATVSPEKIRKTIENAGYKAFETRVRMAV